MEKENKKGNRIFIGIMIIAVIIFIGIVTYNQATGVYSDNTKNMVSNSNNTYNNSNSTSNTTATSDYCIETGCTNKRASGSIYCYTHKPNYSSSSNSSSSSSSSGSYSSSSKSFTNKYGTSTTKCHHSGCDRNIASSGDTNCCTTHSKKCGNCKKYIDEDALYCMDCIEKALYNN